MDYKNYILCGLLAFGMVATAYSKPAAEERSAANEETLQNDQNDDYEYEDRNSPADQVKSIDSNPKSTVLPYFDNKIVKKTVKPGGNITLECPVKNLADTNVILWFKEENTITNNLNVLDNAYEVAKQNFSLIIKNATESFAGNYYCEIAPQKIRMQTILKVSNETIPVTPGPSELPQVKEAVTGTNADGAASERCAQISVVLVSLLVSNLLSHRKCFQLLLSY